MGSFFLYIHTYFLTFSTKIDADHQSDIWIKNVFHHAQQQKTCENMTSLSLVSLDFISPEVAEFGKKVMVLLESSQYAFHTFQCTGYTYIWVKKKL